MPTPNSRPMVQGTRGRSGRPGTVQVGRTQGQASRVAERPAGKKAAPLKINRATKPRARQQSGDQAKGQDQAKAEDGRSEDKAEGKQDAAQGDQKDSEPDSEKSSEPNEEQRDSSSQSPKLPSLALPAFDWLRTPIIASVSRS